LPEKDAQPRDTETWRPDVKAQIRDGGYSVELFHSKKLREIVLIDTDPIKTGSSKRIEALV
jgi:hypothetical protein